MIHPWAQSSGAQSTTFRDPRQLVRAGEPLELHPSPMVSPRGSAPLWPLGAPLLHLPPNLSGPHQWLERALSTDNAPHPPRSPASLAFGEKQKSNPTAVFLCLPQGQIHREEGARPAFLVQILTNTKHVVSSLEALIYSPEE